MKQQRTSSGRSNFAALAISGAAVAFLYGNFDPLPAGEDIRPAASATTALSAADVPTPPEMRHIPRNEQLSAGDLQLQTVQGPEAEAGGCVLNGRETVEFCVLLLQDGIRFLRNVDTYRARFTKLERVGGDLLGPEVMDLKVRHDPGFAVHMIWRNGDKGRQVLFSEDYEDGRMVVKLGGFKRLLPALRLDPHGPEAMAQARYPITCAGVLGMAERMLSDRRQDLERCDGLRCDRLPNGVVDERDCFCFELVYDSPDVSETYRRSIVWIDTAYHIPLRVVNYTWAAEGNSAEGEELDRLTLIEDYSFSMVDFSEQLAAEDFSRDNPRYRM